ncbi:MAG TPA: MFS transporter [Candidatus Acidoferrum sp.]|nr:MFS transporter [Candidatus Acidoferrum sp.]
MPERESLASARLWLAFATMLFVSGIGNTFPVFFPPLLQEFGGSRAATALTVTLMWTAGAALGPVAGYLVDRWSPRALIAVGLGAAAVGLAVAALAPTLTVFSLGLGLGVGVGVGLTGMVPQAAVIAADYRRRRGVATGIAFAGSMAGYVMATPAHWVITNLGWRTAVGAYAIATLALMPCVWRVYPRRLGAGVGVATVGTGSVGALARKPTFWALAVFFTIAPHVGLLATLQHAVYFGTLGYPAWEASLMLLIGGVLSTSGRALAGLVADRIGAPATGFLSFGLTLAGTLCLLGLEFWPARALAYGYVAFLFVPIGTRATIVSMLVPRIAPPGKFGTVFGWLSVGNSLGAATGPLLSGALYDLTRSYLVIYATAATLVTIAIIALAIFVRGTSAPPAR